MAWSTRSATTGDDVKQFSGFDHQRILNGVGNNFFGTCTDQGLFVWTGPSQNNLQSLGGKGLGLVIAIGPAIANGKNNIVTTAWDRGPTASWDGGNTWAATAWYGSQWWYQPGPQGAPADVGEGGYARTLGDGGMHVFIYKALYNKPGNYWFSSDGGKNFNAQGKPFPNGGYVDSAYSPFDYARDQSKPTGRAYIITDKGALQSDDFGATWSNAAFGNPPVTPRSVTVDPTNGSIVWILGASCICRWDGNSWSTCMTPGSNQDYRELIISPTDSSKMLVVVKGGPAMRTTDSGTTWNSVTDGAVNQATTLSYKAMAAYSFSGKTIALAASVTVPGQTAPHVFKSQDDGATWAEEAGGNLVTLQLNSVAWNGGDLILGTSGQGIVKGAGFDS
jgi:hypothetical protein